MALVPDAARSTYRDVTHSSVSCRIVSHSRRYPCDMASNDALDVVRSVAPSDSQNVADSDRNVARRDVACNGHDVVCMPESGSTGLWGHIQLYRGTEGYHLRARGL